MQFKILAVQLVSYLRDSNDQLALLIGDFLYNMDELHPDLPGSIGMFLNYWEDAFPLAKRAEEGVKAGRFMQNRGIPYNTVQLLAPVPFPTSYRSAHSFYRNVVADSSNRDVFIPQKFDQYPGFHFGNHHSIQGTGEIRCLPDHLENLDFQFGVAIVICKHGRNIRAAHADEYVGGVMIMNDMCASKLQMGVNSPLAGGAGFSTATGPVLITPDDLEQFEMPAPENHIGKSWNLPVMCNINGVQMSEWNLGDMTWTFAELIEQASYGADLYPGDIIGSGAPDGGCFFQLNQTGKQNNPAYNAQWLQAGDAIEMQAGCLGCLSNLIVAEEENWSILKEKKI